MNLTLNVINMIILIIYLKAHYMPFNNCLKLLDPIGSLDIGKMSGCMCVCVYVCLQCQQ